MNEPAEDIVRDLAAEDDPDNTGHCHFCGTFLYRNLGDPMLWEHKPSCIWRRAREWQISQIARGF